MTGLSIAFGIVLPAVLSYTFIGSLVFRVLKKLDIGVHYVFRSEYGGTVALSIFWPVTILPLVIFKSMMKASKSVFELIESRMEDEGADDQGRD